MEEDGLWCDHSDDWIIPSGVEDALCYSDYTCGCDKEIKLVPNYSPNTFNLCRLEVYVCGATSVTVTVSTGYGNENDYQVSLDCCI
jgi:hypothetical protein